MIDNSEYVITVVIDADDETSSKIDDALRRAFPTSWVDVVEQAYRVPPGGLIDVRRNGGSYSYTYSAALRVRRIVDGILDL
jgi:hypothetical protein